MAPASIRVRLTAWYGGMLTFTLVGLGFAVYVLMAQALLERVDEMLDFELEEAKERLAAGQPAEMLAGAAAAFHAAYLLRIVDPDGRVVAQSPKLADHVLPVPHTGDVGKPSSHGTARLGALGSCRVVAGEIGAGAGRRIIQIATSLDVYEDELSDLQRVLWTILPAGLLAATLGGYALAGRSLAPVRCMTEAARRISAANLGERIGVANSSDELGQLAVTLNAMLDRIDRAFAAMQRFTADAAHELKSPVASIRTEAEVALLARRSPGDYEEMLRSIVEEAGRLSRLADRLLLLSREDAGAGPRRGVIRLDEAVQAAVGEARGAAQRAGLSLRVEGLPGVEVAGDFELLREVFDNILDNAVKYTPPGGEVIVRGDRIDGRAVVEVTDTGIGIPADALPRIFDRFFRVDPSRSRRTGGTGLGLSIARAVVKRHDGSIDVTSCPGRGSTFRVSLPIRSPAG